MQFPFQLMPSMENILFENNAFHHLDCKKSHYLLKDETNYVNIICSNIAEHSTMKSILNRSSQGFDELKTFNNKYLTHQQLSRCNSYHVELNKSKLQIFHMQ